jgi:hypothetical protein
MSKERIAIISEGEKTEKQIIENLRTHFFTQTDLEIEFLPFKTNIYGLYNVIKDDEFIDIIELLKERESDAADKLENLTKNDISQIYLFFDYDGHAKKDDPDADNIVAQMIEIFNNETENGKMYVSYPMVEAVKHLKNDEASFKNQIVPAKENIHYKNIVATESDFQNLTQLRVSDWFFITDQNLKKVNFIFTNQFEVPDYDIYTDHMTQNTILQQQRDKYIDVDQTVAVLSAFPFFIIDYFGRTIYATITENQPDPAEV